MMVVALIPDEKQSVLWGVFLNSPYQQQGKLLVLLGVVHLKEFLLFPLALIFSEFESFSNQT